MDAKGAAKTIKPIRNQKRMGGPPLDTAQRLDDPHKRRRHVARAQERARANTCSEKLWKCFFIMGSIKYHHWKKIYANSGCRQTGRRRS